MQAFHLQQPILRILFLPIHPLVFVVISLSPGCVCTVCSEMCILSNSVSSNIPDRSSLIARIKNFDSNLYGFYLADNLQDSEFINSAVWNPM